MVKSKQNFTTKTYLQKNLPDIVWLVFDYVWQIKNEDEKYYPQIYLEEC